MTRDRFADRDAQGDSPAFEVRQAFWGYIIRRSEGTPILVQITQGLVLTLAAAFLAAGLVMLRSPADQAIPAVGLAAAALLLLRFAMRGSVVELHVDLARGELREIVSHRIGRVRTGGGIPFDPSISLHIERTSRSDNMRSLVLHYRGGDEGLCIARGPEAALQALRQRITHDLRVGGPGGQPRTGAR